MSNVKDSKLEITVSNRTIVRIVVIILATVVLVRVLDNMAHVLELIFIAFFLSLALNPAVTWLVHKVRLKSRIAATAVAYIIVLSIVVFFSIMVIAPLVRQSVVFVREAPEKIHNLKTDDSSAIGKFVQRYNLEDEIDGISTTIRQRTSNIREPLFNTASRVGSALIAILTVFVITFMMLIEGPQWLEKFASFQSKKHEEHTRKLAAKMYQVVIGYVNGQLLLALLASLFALVALLISSSLLHVSINAVALAGIVFVTGLIPMIGHIIGGVVVFIACLFVSLPLALIMGVYLIAHQQIENVTLQPYIQAKYNELTPLLVFVAALIGISMGGLLGGFVAIPVAGCLKILLLDYLEQRKIRNA